MAIEREHKFLVKQNWKSLVPLSSVLATLEISQGYFPNDDTTIRIRTVHDLHHKSGYVTFKYKITARDCHEYEYPIPFDDAKELMTRCGKTIFKTRTEVAIDSHPTLKWEVDTFAGNLAGPVIAELELPADDSIQLSDIVLPEWIGNDVTYDSAYKNVNLVNWQYKSIPRVT